MRQSVDGFRFIADAVVSGCTGVREDPMRAPRQGKSIVSVGETLAFRLTTRRSLQTHRNLPDLVVGGFEPQAIIVITLLAQRDVRGIAGALRLYADHGLAGLFHPCRHDLVDWLVRGFGLCIPE